MHFLINVAQELVYLKFILYKGNRKGLINPKLREQTTL